MGVPAPSGLHLFAVRHHSPRTSLVLERFLERVAPELILVEGPEDATPLIPALVDPGTVPPVAILAYRTEGDPGSALWPFASYSPEWVALSWAARRGVPARFIDLPSGVALASREDAALDPGEPVSAAPEEDVFQLLAERAGHRSFEELWEAAFEAPAHGEEGFQAALFGYAELVHGSRPPSPYHRARDAFMLSRIEQALAAGVLAERTVCVLGAAHAAALRAGWVERESVAALSPPVPTATTLVPYSFPRLAEQTGYGAGNRAPQFYQRAYDALGSFRRAALEVLVDFGEHLRLRGHSASLADTIEAYRLATMLAQLRGKGEPGLDEVREASVATLCRGDSAHVDSFLWPSVVGKNLGRVASAIGRNSLQAEFWREVEARRLPRSDQPEDFVLKLKDPLQVGTSVFLHRLRLAQVPYAAYLGTRVVGGRRVEDQEEGPGGVSALTRVSEAWQAQWTPATDVALVERIVQGDSLEEVCRRTLSAALDRATRTADAAEVLLESVVASVPETSAAALVACDRLAAADDDLPSLAAACRALSGLLAYGSSRALAVGSGAIHPLCVKTYERALLRVRSAADGDDEAVGPVKTALRVLHEVALAQPAVDKRAWLELAGALARDYGVHPACAGLAAGLLYLAGALGEQAVSELVAQRLSDALDPAGASAFLGGFLEVNALALVKSRPVVAALDAFLQGIPPERFKDTLPVLRRALGGLSATERRYLVENLLALRRLDGQAQAARTVLLARDKEQLAALGQEMAQAMDDLDDLL